MGDDQSAQWPNAGPLAREVVFQRRSRWLCADGVRHRRGTRVCAAPRSSAARAHDIYFDAPNVTETAIRAYADSIFRRVDWTWAQPRPPFVSMGWHPETGFIAHDWRGFNEAMLLYVLALGSPTHPIDPAAWEAWTRTYHWTDFNGQPHVNFAPR
ncbi:MAG: glucoamylase family protein [Gemmatimonadaceae bacterium]